MAEAQFAKSCVKITPVTVTSTFAYLQAGQVVLCCSLLADKVCVGDNRKSRHSSEVSNFHRFKYARTNAHPTFTNLGARVTLHPIAPIAPGGTPVSTRSESKGSQRLSHFSFGWGSLICAS